MRGDHLLIFQRALELLLCIPQKALVRPQKDPGGEGLMAMEQETLLVIAPGTWGKLIVLRNVSKNEMSQFRI